MALHIPSQLSIPADDSSCRCSTISCPPVPPVTSDSFLTIRQLGEESFQSHYRQAIYRTTDRNYPAVLKFDSEDAGSGYHKSSLSPYRCAAHSSIRNQGIDL